MSLKRFFSKSLSFILIGAGLYKMLYSVLLIFFVYPQLSTGQDPMSLLIQEGLIEKVIIYWLMMILDGVFGFFLLFKPEEEIRIFHLVAGAIISIASVFFIVRTPLTTDPIFFFLQGLFQK